MYNYEKPKLQLCDTSGTLNTLISRFSNSIRKPTALPVITYIINSEFMDGKYNYEPTIIDSNAVIIRTHMNVFILRFQT